MRKHAKLNRMNNVATVFVFFTVLINIFITALGFEGQVVRYEKGAAHKEFLFLWLLTGFFCVQIISITCYLHI